MFYENKITKMKTQKGNGDPKTTGKTVPGIIPGSSQIGIIASII